MAGKRIAFNRFISGVQFGEFGGHCQELDVPLSLLCLQVLKTHN
jgi:hypothetical protein